MKIRKAILADAAVIIDFNRKLAWESEKLRLEDSTVSHGVSTLLKDASKGVYFVAEEDGEVVGQLMLTYEWSDWRGKNFWWIQSVYVKEECRGRGVFKAMFEHVRQLAREQGDVCGLRLYVENDNEGAKRAYLKLGFELKHYQVFESGGGSVEH